MRYTEEQINWLWENSADYTRVELCQAFNETFGVNQSVEAIRGFAKKHKMPWKHWTVGKSKKELEKIGRKRVFTQEQIDFIREGIAEMSIRSLAKAYSDYFNEPLGQTELRRVCGRNGIENPRREYKALPIGYERWSDYYKCMMIKVKSVSVAGEKLSKEREKKRSGQWQMKQNFVWEKANNRKLPWRWIVIFLDGDRTNYNIDNLYAIPLQNAGTIKRMKLDSENAEVKKTACKWSELHYALRQVERDTKGESR